MPLIVIVNSEDPNRFASYLLEILDAEGFFGRDVHDLAKSDPTPGTLAAYPLVLTAAVQLSADLQDRLRRYVDDGGHLIALRPPTSMEDVFQVEASRSFVNMQAKDRYLTLNHEHELAVDVPCRHLQFMGAVDLYRPNGAHTLAWVSGDLNKPTGFAAITIASYGGGQAAMFAYDVAACVVMQHQGRPENASTGTNADADGDGRWSPNDLFIGQIDPRQKHIPQADMHQALLVRVLTLFGQDACPLPRAWYFPNAAPAIAWFNGDSDGMDRGDFDAIVSTMERHGGAFTVYLLKEHHALFTGDDFRNLKNRGHAFGHHTDLDLQVGVEEAKARLSTAFATYRSTFDSYSTTHRGHCLVWPGWTEMAEILAENGVRIDQSFIPRRFLKEGYLNGSGRPARFIREDGALVDLWEQNTLLTDDGSVEPDKFLIPTEPPKEVIENALGMLEDTSRHYHGVFQVAFHPHLTRTATMWLLEALVKRCRELGIPMVSGDDWATFHVARSQVRFNDYEVDPETKSVRFSVSCEDDIRGLTIMLPIHPRTNPLETVRIRQAETPVGVCQSNGCRYGWVAVDLRRGEEVRVEAIFSNRVDDVVAVAKNNH